MKYLILMVALCTSYCSRAQHTDSAYFLLLDKNGEYTSIKKNPVYLVHVFKSADNIWINEYYNYTGPLIKVESFKDKESTSPHGPFYYYGKTGLLDSGGYVFEGRKDKDWFYHFEKETKTEKYNRGRLISSEVEPRTFGIKRDSSAKKVELEKGEIESELPGGQNAWALHLHRNLRYPERALNLEKQGEAWIQFIIDTNGQVQEPMIVKSVEFSIDQETLRIIRLSDRWTPATKDGVPVKSYKRQPIVFKLEK